MLLPSKGGAPFLTQANGCDVTNRRRSPELGLLGLGHLAPAEFFESVRQAEELGYHSLWLADERFFRDCWVLLASAAASTGRIRLGTCVVDPLTRHPALHATAIATLDEFSGGRTVLGIGAGIAGFEQLGLTLDKPVLRVREAIELIRALLSGHEVDYVGQTTAFRNGRLQTAPAPDVPIMIATNGPKMMELAGAMADEIMVQALGSTQMLDAVRERLEAGAARHDRDPREVKIIARLDTCIDEDREAARDAIRAPMIRHLRVHYPEFGSQGMAGLTVPAPLRETLATFAYGHSVAGSKDAEQLIPDEFISRLALAGTVDEVAAHAAELFRAGVDEITVFPVAADGSFEGQRRVVHDFASEVMPRALRMI